jgi:hypothetical protein
MENFCFHGPNPKWIATQKTSEPAAMLPAGAKP